MTLEITGFADVTPLDNGGFGSVYRAVRTSTGGTVALKQLDRTVDAAEELVERRLRREIAALVALKGHPNVVQVEEMIVTEGGPVIVMEYMDGGSVARHLGVTSPPVERIVHIGACVAAALAAAHQEGIVHRDVKPHNVLLNSFGQVKLCDFGIAAILKTTEMQTRTTSLSVRYASPEELDDSPDVGPPTDVYSLGATLFHMLHGEPPSFRQRGVPSLDNTVVRPSTKPIAMLSSLIDECLRPDPATRPSAAEVQQRLLVLEAGGDNEPVDGDTERKPVAAAPPALPCGRCGASNDANGRYCRSCGTPLAVGAVDTDTQVRPVTTPLPTVGVVASVGALEAKPANVGVAKWVAVGVGLLVVAGVGSWLAFGGADSSNDAAADEIADARSTISVTTLDAPPTTASVVVEVAPTTTVATTEPPLTTAAIEVTAPPPALGSPIIARVSATSVRSDAIDGCGNPTSYQPELAVDSDPDTAWMAAGDASGESFIVELGGPAAITEVGLIPGYAKFDPCTGTDRFEELRRITAVRWTFDDGTVVEQAVEPAPDYQLVAVPAGLVSSRVSMTILATTPPGLERLDHTAMSEIVVR